MTGHTRVALVTGASRGLGLAIARLLAARGYRLALTARGAEALRDAEEELAARTEVLAIAGDVADVPHVDRLVPAALDRFGRIDVLVNNASIIGPSPMPRLENYPLRALEDVFRANTLAPLHLMQHVLPGMKDRGDGVVINVSSDAGVNAYPTWGGYGASKAALEHLSRVATAELDGTGVRIYVVDPGDMNTVMHQEAEPGVDLSHLPSPDASAAAIVHLIEDETAAFGRYEAQALAPVAR
jgi:NAD(P)-dependent dehydrogenase (short-subunit alcohol dehydrogenase family)